jgi:hypothetical protein
MSTVYGENKMSQSSYVPTNRVNFGWLGESWKMFSEYASLWMSAVLIGFYGPIIFDSFVVFFSTVSLHIVGVHGGPAAAIKQMPRPLLGALIFLNVMYGVYMWGGIVRTALKQVYGEPITFRDLFSGGTLFAAMLPYCVLYELLIGAASAVLLIPGLLLGGLLIPGFAMIADKHSIATAITAGPKALWRDRGIAMGFMFVVGAMLAVSCLPAGLGLVATLPMFALISALAYRDMIGLRESRGMAESVDAILGVESRVGVSLTGEPFDDGQNAQP